MYNKKRPVKNIGNIKSPVIQIAKIKVIHTGDIYKKPLKIQTLKGSVFINQPKGR